MVLGMNSRTACLAAALTLLLAGVAGDASAQLLNPGFESPDASGGDVPGTDNWDVFNNVYTTATMSRTGTQCLKTFGPFLPGGGSGSTQIVPAAPGQTWIGQIFAMNASSDPLDGVDFGVYKIEFLDASFAFAAGGVFGVDFFESNAIDGTLPQDTWHALGVGTAPAPPGTAWARAVIVKVDVDGANGGSIFWDDAGMFAGSAGVEGTPQSLSFTLLPNTPNPFSPSTRIDFSLGRPDDVRIGIYDVRGRLITTLLQARLGAGPHSVDWNGISADGSKAPAGVYHYVLTTSQGQRSRTMTLLR